MSSATRNDEKSKSSSEVMKREREGEDEDGGIPKKRTRSTVIQCDVAKGILRNLKLNNKFFNNGKVLAWALQPDDPNFRRIHEYVANGQNTAYGLKVMSILRIIANADNLDEAPLEFSDDPTTAGMNRKMLWHGTRTANVPSILENSLKLPYWSFGRMFGSGIYFADMICKSVNYCGGYGQERSYYLFLCDVLLGEMYKSKAPMHGLSSAPTGIALTGFKQHHSVKGCGWTVPEKHGDIEIDGSVWPLGMPAFNTEDAGFLGFQLNYNEYIVYNTRQVIPKYLVKVQHMDKPHYEKFD